MVAVSVAVGWGERSGSVKYSAPYTSVPMLPSSSGNGIVMPSSDVPGAPMRFATTVRATVAGAMAGNTCGASDACRTTHCNWQRCIGVGCGGGGWGHRMVLI